VAIFLPIIGLETYVAARRMTDRDAQKDRHSFHLLLLAEKRGCTVEQAPWLPCEAVALIGRVA
jgi:hypothetical protein